MGSVVGAGLLACATAGLPWFWAIPCLAAGSLLLIGTGLRKGRRASGVPITAILALSLCALVPGGHLSTPWALLTSMGIVLFIAVHEARAVQERWGAVRGEVWGALLVAVAGGALMLLPALHVPWLLGVGAGASALVFAIALNGTRTHAGRLRARTQAVRARQPSHGEGSASHSGTVRP